MMFISLERQHFDGREVTMAETFKTPVCDECGSQNIWADAGPLTTRPRVNGSFRASWINECNDCMNNAALNGRKWINDMTEAKPNGNGY